MPDLPADKVKEGFGNDALIVMNDKSELLNWLRKINTANANILFMSSGNYDGLNINSLAEEIIATETSS